MDTYKKMFVLFCVLLVALALVSCKETTRTGSATKTEEGTFSETMEEDEEIAAEEDPNANEESFVQTGTAEEEVLLTLSGADPSTVVVDLGELVTLNVYSERLKDTHLYNEDLYVDSVIARGKTVQVTIEANEEGIFELVDANMNNTALLRFIVAGTSFG